MIRLLRPLELRREQRGPDPLARLPHRGVGQADDRVRGQAGRDVDLDGDELAVDAEQRGAGDGREHGDLPTLVRAGRSTGRIGECGGDRGRTTGVVATVTPWPCDSCIARCRLARHQWGADGWP